MKQNLVGIELKVNMNTNYVFTGFYHYILDKLDLFKKIQPLNKYSHIATMPRIA